MDLIFGISLKVVSHFAFKNQIYSQQKNPKFFPLILQSHSSYQPLPFPSQDEMDESLI